MGSFLAGLLTVFFVQANLYGAGDLSWLAYGDLRGNFDPCGCDPKSDLGGLERMATLIARERSNNAKIMVFDLGNNFDKSTTLFKKTFIKRGLVTIAPDAALYNTSELDDTEAPAGLPYVLSNLIQEKPHVSSVMEREMFLVFGFVEGSASTLIPWNKALSERVATLCAGKNSGKRKILLFSGSTETLATILATKTFDVVISSNVGQKDASFGLERENPNFLFRLRDPQEVLMVPIGGFGVLRGGALQFGEAKSIKDLFELPLPPQTLAAAHNDKHRWVTWLGQEYDVGSPLKSLIEEYTQAQKDSYRRRIEERKAALAHSPYAGAQACKTCHPAAVEAWQISKHAHALETLSKESKHEVEECVSCHVVGAQDRGGFVSQDLSPHLAGVQCENCHGPRLAHSIDPGSHKGTRSEKGFCVTCHQPLHSPSFESSEYWERIKH